MVAVQHREARVALVERVAVDVVHVERLEMDLEIAIVVAERGVELDAAIEQRLVRHRELVGVVVVVEVVAEHQHERKAARGVEVGEHRLSDRLLRLVAGPAVAHDGEDGAAADLRHRQRRRGARRHRFGRLFRLGGRGQHRQRVGDEIDDDIGVDVANHQRAAEKSYSSCFGSGGRTSMSRGGTRGAARFWLTVGTGAFAGVPFCSASSSRISERRSVFSTASI